MSYEKDFRISEGKLAEMYGDTSGWENTYFRGNRPNEFPDAARDITNMVDCLNVVFNHESEEYLGRARARRAVQLDSANPEEVNHALLVSGEQLRNVQEYLQTVKMDTEIGRDILAPEHLQQLQTVYNEKGNYFNPDYTEMEDIDLARLEAEGAIQDLSDLEPGDSASHLPEDTVQMLEADGLVSGSGRATRTMEGKRRFLNGKIFRTSPALDVYLDDGLF